MIQRKAVESAIQEQTKSLRAIQTDILQEFPIERYLDDMFSSPPLYGYQYISQRLQATFEHICAHTGEQALQTYHKLALSLAIERALGMLPHQPIPESILPLYLQWFSDVLEGFFLNSGEYYSQQKDPFMKDLAVCTLRAIPVGGAWLVETSKIWKKFLICGGLAQFFNGIRFGLFHMKGLSPFYEIHTVDRYIKGFNSEERERCYFRIAGLLKIHPDIKGMCAGSWFYDPALKEISPRLSYLIEHPMQHGAQVFRIGTEDADIKLSLKKSKTRRSLYEAGKYTPTRYLIIWPRKALLRWAHHHTQTC